jgi:cell division septation protein DedD
MVAQKKLPGENDAAGNLMEPAQPVATLLSQSSTVAGTGDASMPTADQGSPLSLDTVDLTTAQPYGDPASGPDNSQESVLSLAAVDIATAQPNGDPASGPDDRRNSQLASDATRQRNTVSVNDSGLESRLPQSGGEGGTTGVDAMDADDADVESKGVSDSTGVPGKPNAVRGQPKVKEANPARGPWVIYLASLRREKDVTEFINRLQSQGVPATSSQTTVDGKEYWRVYVPGFATATQARTNASQIKAKLGLDDFWVAKR